MPESTTQPRSRIYFGPGGGPVDEFGVPLAAGGVPQAMGTTSSFGTVTPTRIQGDVVPFEIRNQLIEADKAAQQKQYEQEVASAEALRQQQLVDELLNRGINPRAMMAATRNAPSRPEPASLMKYFKSGNDIVQIDPKTGRVDAVWSPPPEQKPVNTGTTTRTFDIPEIEGSPGIPFQKKSLFGIDWLDWLWPDQKARAAVPGRPAYRITERVPAGSDVLGQPPSAGLPTAFQNRYSGENFGTGGNPAATQATQATGKSLDTETAITILNEVGGDKVRARELARQRGYILK